MIQAKRVHVKKSSRGWRWLRLLVLAVGAYMVWVLGRGILDIRQAYRRIDEARLRLAEAETKNEALKNEIAEVSTREYIERIARNELLMQKEGETVVVLSVQTTATKEGEAVPAENKEVPNYLKWWNLIK